MITQRQVDSALTGNQNAILASDRVGCIYCRQIFTLEQVQDWFQEDDGKHSGLCPSCGPATGIPTLIPSARINFTTALLKQLFEIYFEDGWPEARMIETA